MDKKFEQQLKDSLRERWPESDPNDVSHAELLGKLKQSASQGGVMKHPVITPTRAVAGFVFLILLAAGLNMVLDSFTTPPAATEENAEMAGPTQTESPLATPGGAATPTAIVTPPSPALPDSVALFPQVTWQFAQALPSTRSEFVLYQQSFGQPANEAAALEMAVRLGIDGQVTSYPGEGEGTIYQVADQEHTLILLGFEDQFSYFSNNPLDDREPLPFVDRVQAAEDFLTAAGLLSFPYRTEQDPADPHAVRFVQLLDGAPLIYGLGMNPGLLEWITVGVDADGRIASLYHSAHAFTPVEKLTILSAAEAWARFAAPDGGLYAQYAVLAQPLRWTQPEVPLEESMTGFLSVVNGVTELYADDGRTLIVDSVPPNLPDGVVAQIRGTVSEGHLTWGEIFIGGPSNSYGFSWSCGGGGGGGGSIFPNANFGGGEFAQIGNPGTEVVPTEGPYISPVQPGDAVEAVEGTVYSVLHVYPNGVQQLEVNFWVAGSQQQVGWTGLLEGEALAGAEALQNLPGRIWGQVTSLNEFGLPVIQVDRLEAVHPGLQIQAWSGTEEIGTIDGKQVVLFTTADGEQYVTHGSIEFGANDLIGRAGDLLILEGYVRPAHHFGGFPVLTVLAGSTGFMSLDEYEIQSSQIGIQDESLDIQPETFVLQGAVMIETVELGYAGVSLGRCSPEFLTYPGSEQWLYVQPVWRFLGTVDDGRTIEILVQALPSDYLK